MSKVKILITLIIGLSSVLNAQYSDSPGFARWSAGYSIILPSYNDVTVDEAMTGIHFRVRNFELSSNAGMVTLQREGQSDTSGTSSAFNIGWNTPLSFWSMGERNRGINGYLIQPIVGVHLGTQKLLDAASFSFQLSPGIHVQGPYGLVDLRLNMAYNFGGDEELDGYESLSGLKIGPAISFELDGLYEIWDPETIITGTTTHNTDVVGGGYISHTLDRYSSNVGPFWAVSPTISMGRKSAEGSFLAGIGVSGRLGAFMGDVMLDFGSLSFADAQYPDDFAGTVVEGQFAGSVGATRAMLRVGLDPVYFTQAVLFPKSLSNIEGLWHTKMVRTYIGVKYGKVLTGDVEFESETAAQDLVALFTDNPSLEATPQSDPRLIEGGTALGAFATIEVGSIAFNWEITGNIENLGVAGHSTTSIIYLLPLSRILK